MWTTRNELGDRDGDRDRDREWNDELLQLYGTRLAGTVWIEQRATQHYGKAVDSGH